MNTDTTHIAGKKIVKKGYNPLTEYYTPNDSHPSHPHLKDDETAEYPSFGGETLQQGSGRLFEQSPYDRDELAGPANSTPSFDGVIFDLDLDLISLDEKFPVPH